MDKRNDSLVKSRGGINLAQGIPGFDPPVELIQFLASPMPSYRHQYAPRSWPSGAFRADCLFDRSSLC